MTQGRWVAHSSEVGDGLLLLRALSLVCGSGVLLELRFVGRGGLPLRQSASRLARRLVFPSLRRQQVDVGLGASVAARGEHRLVNAGHSRAG